MGNWSDATKPTPPVCPHCGERKQIEQLTQAVYRCDTCSRNFIVSLKREP